MTQKLALIEFVDEFQALSAYVQSTNMNLSDFSIIAYGAKVQVHLNALKIDYKNTLAYFGNESHKRMIIETEKIVDFIRDNFDFIDGLGLRNVYREEFTNYVRTFLNHLYKLIEITANIIENSGANEIYAFVNDDFLENSDFNGDGDRYPWFINEDERYLGLLAMMLAKSRNMKFVDLNRAGAKCKRKKSETQKPKMKGQKQLEKIFARFLIWTIKNKKVILIPRGASFRSLCRNIDARFDGIVFVSIDWIGSFFPLAAYNIASFLKSFLPKKRFRHFILNTNFVHASAILNSEMSRLEKAINCIVGPEAVGRFVFQGVDCLEFVRNKSDTSFKGSLIRLIRNSYDIGYLYKKIKQKIVMSYSSGEIMAVAGELGKMTGTSCLFISHGTHPVPVDFYHEIELYNLCKRFMLGDYNHVALSTPIQELHLHHFKEKHAEIDNLEIKTGPLILTSVEASRKGAYRRRLNIPDDVFVMTHAVTVKTRNSERYYFLETVDEFISGLADVITETDSMEKARLVIRIHPGFFMNDEEIKSLLPESKNYVLHREGPFSDVLGATDLLISFSSTTIDEALMNRIPVLLYDKWDRYNHFKTSVYEESEKGDIFPVCYVNDKKKLRSALNYMLGKATSTKKKDMDVKKYSYEKDYLENFYKFLRDSLGLENH